MIDLETALSRWQIPALPADMTADAAKPDIITLVSVVRQYLAAGAADQSRRQVAVAEWLTKVVRRNIKRGRIFELSEVLSAGRADCLGYVQVLAALGDKFGLPLGIVEVLMDNAGRYVPHYVNLITLTDGTCRFIDAWYGATDIRHRRMAGLVDGTVRDFNYEELPDIKRLEGLPGSCLEALLLYIRGNRHLARGEYGAAIAEYTRAISLYPANSRIYYNRAVAREKKGDLENSAADYAKAFKDEAGLIRVLARVGDLEPLIKLDEAGISEEGQDIYLWHKGYKTGAPVGDGEISRRSDLPLVKVKEIINEVERRCTS
ncbi:MAG: tetratricopeptide repeat protein [Dehalococcoidales bacterium]|nr:tetratricopeptide repeat protein [Dehalococcoidales bacterium]